MLFGQKRLKCRYGEYGKEKASWFYALLHITKSDASQIRKLEHFKEIYKVKTKSVYGRVMLYN